MLMDIEDNSLPKLYLFVIATNGKNLIRFTKAFVFTKSPNFFVAYIAFARAFLLTCFLYNFSVHVFGFIFFSSFCF